MEAVMAAKFLPSQDILNQLLRYEPETGLLFWKPRPVTMFNSKNQSAKHNQSIWNGKNAGQEAFKTVNNKGYKYASINRNKYLAHRVVWKMINGSEPLIVDHINHDQTDNRIDNLRSVDQFVNTRNCKPSKNNTSGVNGVYWSAQHGKWAASINFNYRKKHIGLYSSLDEAALARKAADIAYGFHANHGKPI
jgi:HNH endonuclease